MGARATGLAAMAAFALLGGCAASIPSAEVTRFHLGKPITRGDIGVQPGDAAQGASLEYENYALSVGRELRAVGFNVAADPAKPDLVAYLNVDRQTDRRRR